MNRRLQVFARVGRLVGGQAGSKTPSIQFLPIMNSTWNISTGRKISTRSTSILQSIGNGNRPTTFSAIVPSRSFQSEAEYHNVADESLEDIQDCIEETLEEAGLDCEINYASGVLTMYLPPHGTFVINKQTPNQQIWWSSPISGPRRYEYSEDTGKWVFSRDENITLGETLKEEFQQMYDLDLDLDV